MFINVLRRFSYLTFGWWAHILHILHIGPYVNVEGCSYNFFDFKRYLMVFISFIELSRDVKLNPRKGLTLVKAFQFVT